MFSYSQIFETLNEAENLFNIPNKEVERLITEKYGYQLKSVDKKGMKTFLKEKYFVHLFYEGNKLKLFDWNQTIENSNILISQIDGYEILPEKTDSYIGLKSIISYEKGFILSIFENKLNLEKGNISFGLSKTEIDKNHIGLRKNNFAESIIDENASFIGGPENFREYLREKLSVDMIKKEKGKIRVHYFIDNEGNITEAHIYKFPGTTLNPESYKYLIKVFKEMPKLKPAKFRGIPVKSRKSMEITL